MVFDDQLVRNVVTTVCRHRSDLDLTDELTERCVTVVRGLPPCLPWEARDRAIDAIVEVLDAHSPPVD